MNNMPNMKRVSQNTQLRYRLYFLPNKSSENAFRYIYIEKYFM